VGGRHDHLIQALNLSGQSDRIRGDAGGRDALLDLQRPDRACHLEGDYLVSACAQRPAGRQPPDASAG